MLRLVRRVTVALLAIVLVGSALMWLRPALMMRLAGMAGMEQAVAQVGGPFTLTGANGKPVSDAAFRGKVMLVYFGYTFCPDVCPTTLQTIAAALHTLGPLADHVAPIFITVDPARDTPKVMGRYVALFDKRLIGLTGTPAEISRVMHEYRVYAAQVPARDGKSYLVNHSSFIYFMGPDGRFQTMFGPGVTPAQIAASVRARLAAG